MKLMIPSLMLFTHCLVNGQVFIAPPVGVANLRSISADSVEAISGVADSGDIEASFFAFTTSYTGGVNVAGGDMNGDGVRDMIVGTNTGLGHVRAFDGTLIGELSGEVTGAEPAVLANFFAFESIDTGGVSVAAEDFNYDGVEDYCVATRGSGGSIRVLDGTKVGTEIFSLSPFGTYSGGLNVCTGVTILANGLTCIAAQRSGGSSIALIDSQGTVIQSFNPFGAFAGGAEVATGDLNGDGIDDIIAGAQAGGLPTVSVYSGVDLSLITSFFAFNTSYTGGVTLATGDVNGDGQDDLIIGAANGPAHVRIADGMKLDQVNPATGLLETSALLADFFAYTLSYTGGVDVGNGLTVPMRGIPHSAQFDSFVRTQVLPGQAPSPAHFVVGFETSPDKGILIRTTDSMLETEGSDWLVERYYLPLSTYDYQYFPIETERKFFEVLLR